ncbi:peroxidase [Pseudonocardia aurantiaca]|uniref:Dyp-type peroxidase n=1 Tax=Pseudonocardia aurantiaca TaxID=75290 RepID=A0ABW4FPB7_9PSEU
MSAHHVRTVPELDFDDIQGTLLRYRPDVYYGVYMMFRIDDAEAVKRSLRTVLPKVTTAADWESPRPFTLNIAFTYSGFEALGVPPDSLASFADEFREGMAARNVVLGDVGTSDPQHWTAPLGSRDVHIGVIISAHSVEALDEPVGVAQQLDGVTMIYQLDVGVLPTGREHFGFRDGIGNPHVIGSTNQPRPGQDEVMPGEFILGYEDELGKLPASLTPDVLARNGTYLAFRQLHEDVAALRRFLRDNARSPQDEELLAAKMVGRWRSGAPLALSPDHDDPELGADPQRNNDFSYYDDDRGGRRTPRGCHIRRGNPRDSLKDSIVSTNLHRVMRRAAVYGPMLADGVLEDDGADRGIVFIFMGAGLARQFEFVQQVWMNDGDFAGLGNEKDPLIGDNDGSGTFTIPAKPLRRRLSALPRFVTVRGGEYFYLPGIAALTWLTTLPATERQPHVPRSEGAHRV